MGRLKARTLEGHSVIAAVHDLSLALRFAGRVIALRDGKLVADVEAGAVDAALLRAVYDVDARVERDADGVLVRYF